MNWPVKRAKPSPAAEAAPPRRWLADPQTLRPGAAVNGPLYAEVKRRVVRGLMEGEWPQDAPLPTEGQLAERYGVSVGTVRKALGELVAEHALVRQPGRGTFATRHDRDSMLEAFFHIVDERGVKEFPASELLSFERTTAAPDVAGRLDLERGAPVIAFETLLRLQGRAVIHDRIAVPQAVFPRLSEALLRNRDMTIFGLYQVRCGVTVARLEEWIRAAAASPVTARHLGVRKGLPVLAIERIARTYDGTPVEYRERYVSTAHHAYLSELGMNRPTR